MSSPSQSPANPSYTYRFGSAEFDEGVAAFLAKRKAAFRQR